MRKEEQFTREDADITEASNADLVRLPLQPLFARTPHLRDADVVAMRARLRDYFVSTFERYEYLFSCLATDEVAFFQGDACNLKAQFSGYDFILAANLIDRLYDPAVFLRHIHERLKMGGVLMLASPYTWLAEHTPREAWLGGFRKDGEPFPTLDGIKACLESHFTMLGEPQEVPFVIRETRRKFQHSISEVTCWERIR